MPLVYRIQKRQHLASILSGVGAQLYGGRWNPVGVPLVYTSSSPELALLESLVHTEGTPWADLPPLVLVELEIPDSVQPIETEDLPNHWQDYPVLPQVQQYLVPYLNQRRALAYSVPSVIVPWSKNLLIDPLHSQIEAVRTVRIEEFQYDKRLM
jgi:RES domain-containing protein